MFSLLGKRLLGSLPQLVAVTFLTYLLVDLAPGNYCDKLLERPTVSEADIRACQAYYGYDQPFLVRYARWLGRALTGDFGMSFEYHRPVFALIVERLGNTLFLAVTALVLSWTLALSLGVASARRPYSWIDKACGLLAYTGLSLPPLLLSILALVLAFKTGWFPIGDTVSSWHSQAGFLGRAGDRLWHVLLPALVIAFTSMAGYMRQMRSSMLETLTQDFVRTARAKGLDERVVVYRHAFVNAVNPLVTLFGYSLAHLLSGSFIVEVVMNWPGMARLTISAIQAQDEPVVMGAVVMATLLLVAGNLVADILLAAVDPRIRLEAK